MTDPSRSPQDEVVPDRECEYQSLVEPPAGYVMLANQLLDLREMKAAMDEEDVSENFVFRGKVRMPDGNVRYFSTMLESTAELGRIAFWQDLWDMMRAYDPSTRTQDEV